MYKMILATYFNSCFSGYRPTTEEIFDKVIEIEKKNNALYDLIS